MRGHLWQEGLREMTQGPEFYLRLGLFPHVFHIPKPEPPKERLLVQRA